MYDIEKLNNKKVSELREIAEKLNISKSDKLKKQELVYKILDEQALKPNTEVEKKAPVDTKPVNTNPNVISNDKKIDKVVEENKKPIQNKENNNRTLDRNNVIKNDRNTSNNKNDRNINNKNDRNINNKNDRNNNNKNDRIHERKDRNINLLNSKYSSTRESIEYLIQLFKNAVEEDRYEVSYVITNFYIDFIKIKPFVDKNEEIGILLMYILLITNGFEVFEYISFMEKVYKSKDTFDNCVLQSTFNWEVGYAQILPLHNFIIDVSLDSYQTLNYLVRDYEFDKQLNKSNNVENTITKLDDTFSKDDIRNIHPYISDSTINRTLKRLRDEGLIRPLGKGRSAKWIKLVKTDKKKVKFEQLDLNI